MNYPAMTDGELSEPSIRTDTAGRDVTNLPGLWSEDDTIHVPPVGQTLKCNQCKKGGDE